ncbi:MAG: shikimate dehydrogenase [Lachnospiraceae bacterium]|jgi:quinate/shikimate dehydrogenase|nr:shikimate dehydrogenase [Lachnospiraceae bacterium]
MEQRIKGSTGLLCLIGSPVGHSGSPAMYNFSFRHHGLDYAYMAFDIREDEAEAAVQAMRLLNVRGFNVTMPCKNVVAGLVDELSPAARIIGAVNTVVNDRGRLVGHMTDGGGFVRNLREHGVDVKDKKIVLLGAGGAATAIAVECALQGARAISVFNASDPFLDRARTTAETLAVEVPGCQVKVICLEDQKALRDEIASGDILVNATSVGMKPREDATLIGDVTMFRPGLVVADTVYNPLETKLMRQAREAGCQVIGGKGMLLWQGAIAFKLYTGLDMPVEEYQKEQEKSV